MLCYVTLKSCICYSSLSAVYVNLHTDPNAYERARVCVYMSVCILVNLYCIKTCIHVFVCVYECYHKLFSFLKEFFKKGTRLSTLREKNYVHDWQSKYD